MVIDMSTNSEIPKGKSAFNSCTMPPVHPRNPDTCMFGRYKLQQVQKLQQNKQEEAFYPY
ncbi:hypothetical protein Csa_015130 [Cucumis sativus]|uniref:Uncharacterized protein n=1 Tax=Cucumis sativus TaxID=3659 RepID=A0A0A0KVY3_CUCSA|nr:hypothetical protein Csa_015130 [Cucumis sativus]